MCNCSTLNAAAFALLTTWQLLLFPLLRVYFYNNTLIIEQDSLNLDLYRRSTKLNLPLSNDCIISAMQAASMTFNLDLYRRFDERQYLSMVDHGTNNRSTRKASDYMERNIYIRRENA